MRPAAQAWLSLSMLALPVGAAWLGAEVRPAPAVAVGRSTVAPAAPAGPVATYPAPRVDASAPPEELPPTF
jgi:hypothetical protein